MLANPAVMRYLRAVGGILAHGRVEKFNNFLTLAFSFFWHIFVFQVVTIE